MKKEFIQLLLNNVVEKRVFASFTEFKRKDFNDKIRVDKMMESLKKEPTYNALIDSGQDPQEIRQMLVVAFDTATTKLKENVLAIFDIVFPKA